MKTKPSKDSSSSSSSSSQPPSKKRSKGEYTTKYGQEDLNEALQKTVKAVFGQDVKMEKGALDAIRESCERFLKYTISRMPNMDHDGYDGLAYILRMDRLKKARLLQAHEASTMKREAESRKWSVPGNE